MEWMYNISTSVDSVNWVSTVLQECCSWDIWYWASRFETFSYASLLLFVTAPFVELKAAFKHTYGVAVGEKIVPCFARILNSRTFWEMLRIVSESCNQHISNNYRAWLSIRVQMYWKNYTTCCLSDEIFCFYPYLLALCLSKQHFHCGQ